MSPDSRFLANIETLLQQLDETELDEDISISALLDRLEDVSDGGDAEGLSRDGWVGRDRDGFELAVGAAKGCQTCVCVEMGIIQEARR